ncbi:cyclin-dependent kinase inhibitor 3 isoform X2 [Heterocephalus glaber]|uniref:Cyclin-dependent kinase inhibitor 3 n=1 Tax=Heterocephalus glaber TaxID=10181 RepID=A0AAX6TD14_HETGA|nr:cyclin-dependent kinase inhibitor 3 isoform X2 [Heterocephalus glaber]
MSPMRCHGPAKLFRADCLRNFLKNRGLNGGLFEPESSRVAAPPREGCFTHCLLNLCPAWAALSTFTSIQPSEFDSSDEEPIEDEQTPIHISWLPLSRVNCSQFLGLCALPGCKFKDVRRNIQKDTEELKSYGIQDIFVFCTRGELSKYRVPNLLDSYQQCGIIAHHHPIPDGEAPDIASCWEIMEELAICLRNNRKTIIHCYRGLGRSCLGIHAKKYNSSPRLGQEEFTAAINHSSQSGNSLNAHQLRSGWTQHAACLLLYLSDTVSPQQAIDTLKDVRGSGAIQTIKQYNYLHEFRDKLDVYLSSRDSLSRSVSR